MGPCGPCARAAFQHTHIRPFRTMSPNSSVERTGSKQHLLTTSSSCRTAQQARMFIYHYLPTPNPLTPQPPSTPTPPPMQQHPNRASSRTRKPAPTIHKTNKPNRTTTTTSTTRQQKYRNTQIEIPVPIHTHKHTQTHSNNNYLNTATDNACIRNESKEIVVL